jgi:hypothetical protein
MMRYEGLALPEKEKRSVVVAEGGIENGFNV